MKTLASTRIFAGLIGLFALAFTSTSALAAVKIATGRSTGNQNAAVAAAEAAAELKAKLGSAVPDIIIISENIGVTSIAGVSSAISAQFPGVPVYGRGDQWYDYDPYTETGITGALGDQDGALALLGICGTGFNAQCITPVISGSGSAVLRPQGQQLANMINPLPADTKLVILFGDHHNPGINYFVPGMIDILGNTFPLVSGSQNDWDPYAYQNGTRIPDPAQAVVLTGTYGVSFAIGQGNSPSYWVVEADAAQRAMAAIPAGMDAKLLLWFNCGSRRGTDLQAHMNAVQAVVGTDLPIFGAYCGGEAGKANNTATITYGTGLAIIAVVYDIGSPTITPDGGGPYVNVVPVTISISNPGAGASIYYTLDGTDPNQYSTLYTGQFVLTADTTVKARTYVAGGSSSDVATAVFAINTSLANEAPAVYAGGYKRIRVPDETVQLNGIVTDGTLPYPPGAITASWSVVSGPAGVVFDDVNSLATKSAVFSTVGQYLLRLTASDSELAASDDVPVYVATAGSYEPVTALLNPSFELDQNGDPSDVKRDWVEVLGWLKGLDQAAGVELIAEPNKTPFTGTGEGVMKGYGKFDVGGGDWWYQVMNHPMVAGDQYRLTFAYGPTSTNCPSVIASFIDGDTMAELANMTAHSTVRFVFSDYTLSFTVPAGDICVGHNLGIKFQLAGATGWASVDNLRLEYVPIGTLAGDLTGDIAVNHGDLKEMTDQWLWSGTAGGIPEDMVASGSVDFVDFAYLANQWLAGM